MMTSFQRILSPEVQGFIAENQTSDLTQLLLKKSSFPDVSMSEIVQQIKGRNVARRKFPFLLAEGIVFPPNLNLEQASSQTTAEFKAEKYRGKSFLDLTAGFGIDAYFVSRNFDNVTLVEQNSQLLQVVKHNWQVLGRNADFITEDLNIFLAENTAHFDLIYLDPARRDEQKRRKFLLQDLSPDILEIQGKLLELALKVMIKLSPLIDISYLISFLKNCYRIDIIAVRNEVRELIVHLSRQSTDRVCIECHNLESNDAPLVFNYEEEKVSKAEYSLPQRYIYIPNNAVLKSGAFNFIASSFGLCKLHANTHLYTSAEKVENFPGRCLEMEMVGADALSKGEHYNIISKNHPLSPDEIKKKYKLRDGGSLYLIFTTALAKKVILRSRDNGC